MSNLSNRNKEIHFLPGATFSNTDAKYFLKYFRHIMNSKHSGQRAAICIGTKRIKKCDTIIELGSGDGSFLSGLHSVTGKMNAKWIGVDACYELLNCAPKWVERRHTTIQDYYESHTRALIIISPCLLETTASENDAFKLLKKATTLAESGIIWFSVHSRHEFLHRFPVGHTSLFSIHNRKVLLSSIFHGVRLSKIQWEIYKNECVLYNREYSVRLRDIAQWRRLANRFNHISLYKECPDDDENGRFRSSFILEFNNEHS